MINPKFNKSHLRIFLSKNKRKRIKQKIQIDLLVMEMLKRKFQWLAAPENKGVFCP